MPGVARPGKHSQRAARLNRLAALQPADPVVLAELGLALLETPSAAQAVRPLRAALDLGLDDDDTALAFGRRGVARARVRCG